MKKIKITTEYIKLDQFLKLSGIADSGGDARRILENTKILVNNVQEERRGRKLRDKDEIRIGQEVYLIEQAGVESCL